MSGAISAAARAVVFDLDGVLTDTAELHYQSWQALADELRLPFDRQANEALRGLSREQSLARVLAGEFERYTHEQRTELLARKNENYLARVAEMTPADLLAGAEELLALVRRVGFRTGIASSSRNAHTVIERLGIASQLDTIVDGNDAPRSKPDPQVFLLAAQRLSVPPQRCIVVEDAASGVEAGLAAGMRVVGLGPRERVGRAHLRIDSLHELTAERLDSLVPRA